MDWSTVVLCGALALGYTKMLGALYHARLAILRRQRSGLVDSTYLDAFSGADQRQIAEAIRDWVREQYIRDMSFPVLPQDSLGLTYGVDSEDEDAITQILAICDKNHPLDVVRLAGYVDSTIAELVRAIASVPADR